MDNVCVGIYNFYIIYNLFNNCGLYNGWFLLSSKIIKVYMNIYFGIIFCIDWYKGNLINYSYI